MLETMDSQNKKVLQTKKLKNFVIMLLWLKLEFYHPV